MSLFDGLIDEKTLRVLRLFLKQPSEFFHINKVSIEAGVPLATTFRIIKSLKEHELIEAQLISKFKIYRLADNKRTRRLKKLL
jgi:DNA-binding IclR family transcriptional regulator